MCNTHPQSNPADGCGENVLMINFPGAGRSRQGRRSPDQGTRVVISPGRAVPAPHVPRIAWFAACGHGSAEHSAAEYGA